MRNKFLPKLVTFATLFATACSNTPKEHYEYNYDSFYGICALTGEAGGGIDKALTTEWTARNIKAMGFKSMRFWISLHDMFYFDENDEIHVNQGYYKVQRNFVTAVCDAGIDLCLVHISAYVYPYGLDYANSYSVPDPEEDPDLYIKFLNANARACQELVKLFPEFDIIEPGNEPDFANATCIHKDGFIWNGGYADNVDYLFNDEVKASIICDLCWYIRKAIREINPELKTSIPGLTNIDTVYDFFDTIYRRIESRTLPIGQEYSDIDPDNYFDYLNWHPYSKISAVDGEIDDYWIEYNKGMYQIACDHGDEGKPVLFSEIGWTTMDYSGEKEIKASTKIGEISKAGVKRIREELPWVEAIFYFRLTNTYWQGNSANGGEEHFGLFYNPDDPEHNGEPRESAKIIAKIINGDDYVLEDHLPEYTSKTRV